ncbi:MAG TPA: alpha-ketoglutarate-dependent dioxygenase AlkB [Polyangiaceae bacterium]|nr:alpha-ketoglutarate-dependent dioxygenase AlkB [Polyangiaceae bacterium]
MSDAPGAPPSASGGPAPGASPPAPEGPAPGDSRGLPGRLAGAGFAVDELGEGAWTALREAFVPGHEALLERLAATLPLRAEALRIAGREVMTPRRTSFHGDPGGAYRYSGRSFEPLPLTPELEALRGALAALTGHRFNAVLVNHYRDGGDAMGWHADDEPELGPNAPDDVLIASVSLGAPRRFVLRHRRRPAERREHWLGGGSLLVMGGTTQRRWQHALPRTARPVGGRMNLTYRIVRAAR